MNYRHIYHAGNFADVMKHFALCLVINHLKKKEAPFCVIDAHAGLGFYNLQSIEAEKTNEWKNGIGCFQDGFVPSDEFKLYHDLIKDDLSQGFYTGSPVITARMLRPQDRLIANELHPQDFETLKSNMRPFKNANITHLDAYQCIRANTPPPEKRGLVLIDPPFEKKDEFSVLIKQMNEWKKRFSNGIFMIWYPIKSHLPIGDLMTAAQDLGMPRTWFFETLINPRHQPETLNGCGVIVFNSPYLVPEQIENTLPWMAQKMGLFQTPNGWITAP